MKTWYKKSTEQTTFGFAEDDSTLKESPQLYHSNKSGGTLQNLLDGTSGYLGIESSLIKFGYKWMKATFPSGLAVVVVDIDGDKYVIDDYKYPTAEDATSWIYKLSPSYLEGLFPDTSFNNLFWESGLTTLYHGTKEEKAADILAHGLKAKNESRGIGNRGTGDAIFMSDNIDEAEYYYPVVFEVDTYSMKADGFTPDMQQEDPILEANLRNSAADIIGLTNFVDDVESGISHTTVVCRGSIPPKYLKIVK